MTVFWSRKMMYGPRVFAKDVLMYSMIIKVIVMKGKRVAKSNNRYNQFGLIVDLV